MHIRTWSKEKMERTISFETKKKTTSASERQVQPVKMIQRDIKKYSFPFYFKFMGPKWFLEYSTKQLCCRAYDFVDSPF